MAKKLDCRLKINKSKKTCINKKKSVKKSTRKTPVKKSKKLVKNSTRKTPVKKSTKRTPVKKSKKPVKKSSKNTPTKKPVKKTTKKAPPKNSTQKDFFLKEQVKSKKLPENYLHVRNPENGKEGYIKSTNFREYRGPSGKITKHYYLTGSDLMRSIRLLK